MRYHSSVRNIADFMIAGSGTISVVRVRKAPRFHGTLQEIAEDLSDAVAGLWSVPGDTLLFRELWAYNRYGNLRYFRVGKTGLVELGPDGKLLVPANGAPATGGTGGPGVPAGMRSDHPDHLPKTGLAAKAVGA